MDCCGHEIRLGSHPGVNLSTGLTPSVLLFLLNHLVIGRDSLFLNNQLTVHKSQLYNSQ